MSGRAKTIFHQVSKTMVVSIIIFSGLLLTLYAIASAKILPKLTHIYLNKIVDYAIEENYYLIIADDPIGNQQYVENLKQIPWLSFAEIHNEQSDTKYSIGKSEWNETTQVEQAVFEATKTQLHIKKPIFTESNVGIKKRLGVLHLAIERLPIKTISNTFLGIILASVLMSILILGPLLRLISERISKPVRQLSEQLNDINFTTDNTGPISIDNSTAELDVITDIVNKQIARLKTYHEEQENIIQERTAELQTALSKVEAAQQEKNALLSGLSHDLRTPLTSLLGFMELASNEVEKSDITAAKASLEIAKRKSIELNLEVTNMLEYLSGKKKENDIVLSRFNLKKLVEESIQGIEYSHEHSNNCVEYKHKGEIIVVTDQPGVQRVINNLITNAFKYCRDGHIKVATRTRDNIEFEITDTGIGIPKDQQEKIFLLNYQAKTSMRMEDRGYGLGLHLCKKWTTRMGGRIEIISEPGKGTTLKISVPNQKITGYTDSSSINSDIEADH